MKPLPFLVTVVALATLPASALAQETSGKIEGRVLDAADVPIASVTVTVMGPHLQGTRTALSNDEGVFHVFQLPVGVYRIAITHEGYQRVSLDDVYIYLGKTTRLEDVQLLRLVVGEEVVVVAERPLLDVTSSTTGGNLSPEYFETVPVQRNYQSIISLLPQADVSFLGDEVNFSGATGLENKYFFDGAEVTDPYRGITGTNLPYNFVRDIEVKSGGYEAEYRSSLGGVVNVVTHSGSNEFHGQAFGFFANDRLAGSSRQGAFELAKGDFTQYDFGLRFGGPIQRDKLWFLASYNPSFQKEDVDIPGVGMYEDNHIQHMFAGKLTWRPTSKMSLNLIGVGDPHQRDAVGEMFGDLGMVPISLANPDPYLATINTGGYTVIVTGNYIASDRFLLDYSVSRLSRKDKYQPATQRGRDELLMVDARTGIWSGGYGDRVDDVSTETTGRVTGSLFMGNHLVKAGLEYRDNKLDMNEQLIGLVCFADSQYFKYDFDSKGTVHNRVPSLFLQDSWDIHRRLRINAGLRWDGQFMIGSNGRVAQKILDQHQPRLGFVYQPGEIGSQKIFASAGRFYQDVSTILSATHHNEVAFNSFLSYDHDPRIDPSGGIEVGDGGGVIQPEVDGLKGQHYDEFTLGYERRVMADLRMGVRGIYRTLRDGIENCNVNEVPIYGNPGRGELAGFPKMKREYTALALTAEKSVGDRYSFLASYVLSRNRGNYTGLFNSDWGWDFPNTNGAFGYPEIMINGYGLLPNDRTHVFKLSALYRSSLRLTVGASLLWESGTPKSIFEGSSYGAPWYDFAQKRGSDGRTPAIWDANMRITYDLFSAGRTTLHPRLIVDLFHIASQRKAVAYDQVRSFGSDGANPNPTFGWATRYQPPMAVRLGTEVNF